MGGRLQELRQSLTESYQSPPVGGLDTAILRTSPQKWQDKGSGWQMGREEGQ